MVFIVVNTTATLVTADQWRAIKDGTFDDLFIGDFWNI
ncbi:hypothetical protein EVA_21608, partial [gut metagenome]